MHYFFLKKNLSKDPAFQWKILVVKGLEMRKTPVLENQFKSVS